MPRPADLPDFQRPPVVEVALGVQFQSLAAVRGTHMGLYWSAVRSTYPHLEEHRAVPPTAEEFGARHPPGVSIELSDTPPVPRCWFLTDDRSRVVQVQPDRFVCNWRRLEPSVEYPRYEVLREEFRSAFSAFREFVVSERLGDLILTQAEVTYVNEIPVGSAIANLGQLEEVLRMWRPDYDNSVLDAPEDIRVAQRHLITDESGSPYARLYITAEPVHAKENDALLLTVVVRGRPGPSPDAALTFFDMGRERIVRSFTAITTEPMHSLWERLQ